MIEVKRGPGRPPGVKTIAARAAVQAVQQMNLPGVVPQPAGRQVSMRYDAAGQGRRMAGWNAPTTGPNTALAGLQTIRNRSRDTNRNDWSGRSGTQKWSTTLIGIGITPRFKRLKNKARKQAVLDIFSDFVRQADADGVNNLYGLQTLVVKTWFVGGEAFIRRRARFLDEGFAVPMQIQVLSPEMCPMQDAETLEGMPVGNVMRSGIEFNKRGRRIAYWFYKNHPSDNGGSIITGDELVRVMASDVCHVFEPEEPGQLRGVPNLAPILARLRNVENYDDATLERQKLANMFVAFLEQVLPKADENGDVIDPMTGQAIVQGPSSPLIPLQPGLFQELDPGQKVIFSNPPEAGTNYSEYMRTQHLGTSAAAGIPYEIFSGDIANVSDRTLRILINEFRRLAEQRQWQVIIPMMCDPVSTWFADAALLANLISINEYEDVRRVEHAPHGWAHIHPVQDPQGKLLEIDGGLRSRSSVIGEKGDDPDQVDDERQSDDAREQVLKIGPYSEAMQQINNPPEPEPEDNVEDQEDRQVTSKLKLALVDRAKRESDVLDAAVKRMVKEPVKPEPVIDVVAQQQLTLTATIIEMLKPEVAVNE